MFRWTAAWTVGCECEVEGVVTSLKATATPARLPLRHPTCLLCPEKFLSSNRANCSWSYKLLFLLFHITDQREDFWRDGELQDCHSTTRTLGSSSLTGPLLLPFDAELHPPICCHWLHCTPCHPTCSHAHSLFYTTMMPTTHSHQNTFPYNKESLHICILKSNKRKREDALFTETENQ